MAATEPRGPAGAVTVWGVLNVTPDSFSDGGRFLGLDGALLHARAMRYEGADVIDVGGESSRPQGATYGAGAPVVDAAEECRRVLPVIEALVADGATVSVDTVKPEVARRALAAGARIVNDVSGGRSDALLEVVAAADAELVLMHTRGKGEVASPHTTYGDLVGEVVGELLVAVARAERAGVPRERLWIDPGLGFAKTAAQSAALLARTDALVATGLRVLVGPSRKSFVAELARLPDGTRPATSDRLGGSLAAVTVAVLGGAHAVRVHDVAPSRQAALVAVALREARR